MGSGGGKGSVEVTLLERDTPFLPPRPALPFPAAILREWWWWYCCVWVGVGVWGELGWEWDGTGEEGGKRGTETTLHMGRAGEGSAVSLLVVWGGGGVCVCPCVCRGTWVGGREEGERVAHKARRTKGERQRECDGRARPCVVCLCGRGGR